MKERPVNFQNFLQLLIKLEYVVAWKTSVFGRRILQHCSLANLRFKCWLRIIKVKILRLIILFERQKFCIKSRFFAGWLPLIESVRTIRCKKRDQTGLFFLVAVSCVKERTKMRIICFYTVILQGHYGGDCSQFLNWIWSFFWKFQTF